MEEHQRRRVHVTEEKVQEELGFTLVEGQAILTNMSGGSIRMTGSGSAFSRTEAHRRSASLENDSHLRDEILVTRIEQIQRQSKRC